MTSKIIATCAVLTLSIGIGMAQVQTKLNGSGNGPKVTIKSGAIAGNQTSGLSISTKRNALLDQQIETENTIGVPVQIQTIAHYRGAREFQLSGIGLVIGLDGTGDSKKSQITQDLYANYFRSHNLTIDPTLVQAKNVALVQVTASMRAFTKPGTLIDVTVSSIADAKSLQGGTLILTPLYGPTDPNTVIASAQGPLSIGGFNASANGSSVQQNALNVGRIPGGAEIQTRIDSQVVFQNNGLQTLYLDLDHPSPDALTRVVNQIQLAYPEYDAQAIDETTISLIVPKGVNPDTVMSHVNGLQVSIPIPAKVVINERTGTIVVGGDVSLGPAMIVSGSLNVRIDTTNTIVQPSSFSNGTTATQSNSKISAKQQTAKVTVIPAMTTVADLARIFQALQLKPNDVIQILQLLQQQGALKARIVLQ